MKHKINFLIKNIIFWVAFFIFSRVLFIIYNYHFCAEIPFSEIAMSFIKGIKLDLSMMGYICFFLSLIIALTFWANNKTSKYIFNIYNISILVILSLITVIDAELYRNWGFRIDSTIFLYLTNPTEAMASTPIWLFLLLVLLTAAIIFLWVWIYKKTIVKELNNFGKTKWLTLPIFLFFTALLFLPIRGSLGIAPINTGAVYFSNHTFANHAALNVHWNFGESVTKAGQDKTLSFMPKDEANNIFNKLYSNKSEYKPICKTKKPNIIILILESFSARMIKPLGGMADVTPHINQLVHKGILFNHFFANGDRSDKGIVSILSGYPAQPTTSIIKNSNKSEKLPFLTRRMNAEGYHTTFYYGGDINFANMRQYLINSQFNDLIYLKDFDAKDKNSKWGIHDHVVFNRFLKDCNQQNQPFFKAFFTLSSHEPFEVPHKSKFNGGSEEQLFLNSAHYTDSCLGDFVQKAEKQEWWNNTIMFVVADHSGRHPNNVNYSSRIKFEIPLLILGGALNVTDTVIPTYCNQTDIPKMIGRILNKDFEEFKFSKNSLFEKQSFAFYVFNDGFGYFTKKGGFIFDNKLNKSIYKDSIPNNIINEGKAFMQTLIEDYNNK